MAETNFHSDAFRKGTTPNASPSLVQERTGFSPVEDMAIVGQPGRPARHGYGPGQARPGKARH